MNNVLSGTFRVYGGGRDAALRFVSLKKQHQQNYCISTGDTINVILYRCEFPRGSHIVSNIVWEKVGDSPYGYNRSTASKTLAVGQVFDIMVWE